MKIHQLLIANKCVNEYLILKVFHYICEQEEARFYFTNQLQKKIRSALTYLRAKWKIVGRKRVASKKYIAELTTTFFEFDVYLNKDNEMDIDPTPLEGVFKKLKIS